MFKEAVELVEKGNEKLLKKHTLHVSQGTKGVEAKAPLVSLVLELTPNFPSVIKVSYGIVLELNVRPSFPPLLTKLFSLDTLNISLQGLKERYLHSLLDKGEGEVAAR